MIGVFLADGFEEIEALTVIDYLRRVNLQVKGVSITDNHQVTGAHGITVLADLCLKDFEFDRCQMIVLPGGMPGTTNLLKCQELCDHIKTFVEEKKWVSAICAAPMILGENGLLQGRKATIYPGMEEHLLGCEKSHEAVVIDEKIITSPGPGKAAEFALTIIEKLVGPKERADLERSIVL